MLLITIQWKKSTLIQFFLIQRVRPVVLLLSSLRVSRSIAYYSSHSSAIDQRAENLIHFDHIYYLGIWWYAESWAMRCVERSWKCAQAIRNNIQSLQSQNAHIYTVKSALLYSVVKKNCESQPKWTCLFTAKPKVLMFSFCMIPSRLPENFFKL